MTLAFRRMAAEQPERILRRAATSLIAVKVVVSVGSARASVLARRRRRASGERAPRVLAWLLVALALYSGQRGGQRLALAAAARRAGRRTSAAARCRVVPGRDVLQQLPAEQHRRRRHPHRRHRPARRSKTLATTVVLVDRGLGLMGLVLVAARRRDDRGKHAPRSSRRSGRRGCGRDSRRRGRDRRPRCSRRRASGACCSR